MDEELSQLLEQHRSGALSRREFVQRAVAAGMTMSAIGMLLARTPIAHAAHAEVKKGGTLRLAIIGPAKPLDPALIGDDGTIEVCKNIYSYIVRLGPTLVPEPDLASSFSMSADGKAWTFNLRKGVKFHSGKPFNADDVIYTVKRSMDPKVGSGAASLLTGIFSIQRVDDYTVKFHLKAPDPDFAAALGDYHMCVIENNFKGNFAKNASGTGPFKLAEYVPADHALLVRNPNYFEAGLPYLDAIKLLFLPDESTRVNALKSGSVDFIQKINVSSAPLLQGAPGIKVVTLPGTSFNHLRMRCDKPPFNDARVRQAFKYVVDRPALNAVINKGLAPLANDQPIGPAFAAFYTDIGLRAHDVSKAKALLAAAGHTNGLSVELVASPYLYYTDLAAAYQQLASAAGITIKIISETLDVYYGSNNDWINVEFGITGWAARAVPSVLLKQLYRTGSSYNEVHYSNPKLDALIDSSSQELDPAKRKAQYKQIEQIISDDGGTILPFYSSTIVPYNTRVHDTILVEDGWHFYKKAWLS